MFLFSVLVALGVWQLQRLAWKEGVLAEIARSEQAPPVKLTSEGGAYRRVVVSGRLRWDLSVLYGAEVRDLPGGTVMGAQVIVPLVPASGPAVLVDIGWLPEGRRPVGADAGEVTGYVRPPDRPGWFAPADDVAGRRFYTLDPAVIGAALGLGEVAPFVVVAMGETVGGAVPAEHLPRPPNDHLSYAFTWFGLAAALLVIFSIRAWGSLRA